MSDVDLDKQREEIIEEIKRVFPVKPRPKELVHKHFRKNWEGKFVIDKLEGKSWTDLIDDSSFAYSFNDIDFTSVINKKAFIYYLPAFLVFTVLRPWDIVSQSAFIKIKEILPELGVDKLQVLISYFTYQGEYSRNAGLRHSFAENYDDLLLHLLFALDEKKPKS